MFTGLWIIGVISWGIVGGAQWEETLYVEDELVSRTQCSLRFEQGWHSVREMEFEKLRAYWPEVTPKVQWEELFIQAVHHDLKGQLVQIDTKHFQHRLEYSEGRLIGIHTSDPWEEHQYEVVWGGGLPVKLVGHLERIHMVYDSKGRLSQVTETWLDEPEMRREVTFKGDDIKPRGPLPFSMGWLFTREGKMNPQWQAAWWLSKQRYPDAVASVAQD
jgi:hypothetical protein